MRYLRLVLYAAALAAGAATIEAQACADVCHSCSVCHQTCIEDMNDWPRVWITCGQWGTCTNPVWVETGRTFRGRFQKEWPLYCEVWEVYTVYQTDATGCNPNRAICDELFTGDRSWGTNDCCVDHGCWGQQYGC